MIIEMDTPIYEDGVTIRTTPDARSALRQVVARLKSLKFFKSAASQEAIINASWLWMQSMDPDELRAGIEEHLGQLKEAMEVREAPPAPAQLIAGKSIKVKIADSTLNPRRNSGKAKERA